jgi:hypothetical protein
MGIFCTFTYYNWILCHSLLDLFLAEIKRNIGLPSADYMINLAQKLNRFIVNDSDKLEELLMRLYIMDKTEKT